jgi:uncharacterized membrane protein
VKTWAVLNNVAIGDFVLVGWNFYGGLVTIGAAGAFSAALLVGIVFAVVVTWMLVPAFVVYEFETPPSDLDRQTAIAKLVRTLRS